MANIEALEQLKRVVRETPDSEFHMGSWTCGSVACAFGRAAMDGWFQDRGLKSRSRELAMPWYRELYGFDAATSIFDISHCLVLLMLSVKSYEGEIVCNISLYDDVADHISRDMVINRIQQVIDHYTVQKDTHVIEYCFRRQT